jgi:hypothetical protein
MLFRADGGFGKSCLAADVGMRLAAGGHIPGGAYWVDMREAGTAAEVEARFCTALSVKRVGCTCATMMPRLTCPFRIHSRSLEEPRLQCCCHGQF